MEKSCERWCSSYRQTFCEGVRYGQIEGRKRRTDKRMGGSTLNAGEVREASTSTGIL